MGSSDFDPDAYLKRPKPSAAGPAPFDPDAYLKDLRGRKAPQPEGSPIRRAAGDFLYGVTHPTEEADPHDPYHVAQEVGGYVPGTVAGMIAPETYLAQAGIGGVSGALSPAKDWRERALHSAEGAAAGLIPAPLRMIPRQYLSALDALASAAVAHGFGATTAESIWAALLGSSHRFSPWFDLGHKAVLNPGITGRAAAQASDKLGVTGQQNQ